jgi:hypothetical protein
LIGVTNIGVKILKEPNKEIDSSEFSDFSVHTKTKALSIQQVGVTTADSDTDNQIVIEHNLGYPPSFITGRLYNQGDTFITLPEEQAMSPMGDFYGKTRATSNQLSIGGSQSVVTGTFAYIIFKDPLERIR